MAARSDDVVLQEKDRPSQGQSSGASASDKKLKRCRLVALVLAIFIVILLVVIAVIAWLLVDVSTKSETEEVTTMAPTKVVPRGTFVSFPSDNPEGSGTGMVFGDPKVTPLGLIAIHAWWGITANFQEQGAIMARDGNLTVLIIDIYRGEVADDREEAGHLRTGLDWKGAMDDVSGGVRYLKEQGCTGVGVTGFCMGGALCLAAAANSTGLSAAAPFYGIPSADQVDMTTITIPIQGHYGKEDRNDGFSSPTAFKALKQQMDAAGVRMTMYEYDEAGHGFANIGEGGYRKEQAEVAMGRLYKFMHDNL